MLDKIMQKLDKLSEDVNDVKVTVAVIETDVSRNTEDVAEHIRRTDLLESKVHKTTVLAVFLLGAASVYYWPQVITLLRIVI